MILMKDIADECYIFIRLAERYLVWSGAYVVT